jgi:hypothetical protein
VTTHQVRSAWIPAEIGKAISKQLVDFPSVEKVTGKGNLVLWQGYIKIPQGGKYTFKADRKESRFFMRIHDIAVLDGNFETGNSPQGSVYLEAGYHPVKIYLLKDDAATQLDLSWKIDEGSMEMISSEFWFR